VDAATYSVRVNGSKLVISGCMPALPIFMGLAGYRISCRFSKGDQVGVIYGNPSYIVQGLPKDVGDWRNARSRTHTGFGHSSLMQQAGEGNTHTYPNDLFDGEFEIANLMGMAMVFATNMISVKAGDRAKVETHMLNDMVRIISNEFRHHSALGDEFIFDDGRLSGEANFTSYRHEAHGAKTKKDLLAKLKNNKSDFSGSDSANDTGYWRGTRYVGWLGDFLHWFVAEPHTAAATIGQEGWRAGRSRIWTGNDGTVLIQSVADIVLERVVRVLVPRRKKRHDDPGGKRAADFDKMSRDWLKKWQDTDPNRPWERAFQLREYSRWLSQRLSLARFRQASSGSNADWEIPSETNPDIVPTRGHKEEDVEAANTQEYEDAYATIRIYRDGSIGLQETEGAAITMAHGSIWMSATRHLWLEAAGDIRMAAGQNILMRARRSIDLVAEVGGIIMKSRTWFKMLCERGSMWIKGDAADPAAPGYEAYTPEAGDPQPEVLQAAVYIQADNGRTEVRSTKQLWMHVDGAGDTDEEADVSAAVVIESRGQHVQLKAGKDILVKGDAFKGNVGRWLVSTTKALWSCGGLFDINGMLTLRGSRLHTNQIVTKTLDALSRISGRRKGPEPPRGPDGKVRPGTKTGPLHYNHINIVDDELELELATAEERKDVAESKLTPASGRQSAAKWSFSRPGEYLWDRDERAHATYKTPSQQILDKIGEFPTWSWGTSFLLPSPNTYSGSQPWGATYRFKTTTAGALLNAPSDETPKTQASGWTSSQLSFRFVPYE